ncbi:exodeoxyribonuclease VII large subunit [Alteromonas facilis]|uniref:exodeoxyribonuclease VII large subunit n=1 Tax=Alteromonas facilis TaxID=2048004 RepID=UPI000C286FFC|nr:exodeoxyribonuclease VII large subunit [Alteromonas facilis]
MIKPPADLRQIYSVTKLNRFVRSLLEGEIGTVWLSAEISNFTAAASGHWYFTLKDSKAQIKSAMFRGANSRLQYRPKEGDKVLVRGNLSLYEPRGDYQLIAEYMELDGLGNLQAAFEALKAKLNALGLFNTDRKRPLPSTINTVGVVTSASGAALHDILTVLKRRSPGTKVIVYPTQVQGERAHLEIINAIETANSRREVDVLIVGRGGGSIEDLWCFNHEQLAHCIAQSTLPVISAVGHEVDITIADLVADLRAPTPSAAAELVSQDRQAQSNTLNAYQRHLLQLMQRHFALYRQQLASSRAGIERNHPSSKLNTQAQRLDDLQRRLDSSTRRSISATQNNIEQLQQRLLRASPLKQIQRNQTQLHNEFERIQQGIKRRVNTGQHDIQRLAAVMHSLSPLATLSRGFSVTYHNERVLHDSQNIQTGDQITTQLEQGQIISVVKSTHK